MSAHDYLTALYHLGAAVVVERDITDCYQGDHAAIIVDDTKGYADETDRHGFLLIGYGSCSGCDAWQSAATIEERLAVVKRTLDSVRWFDTFAECREYVLTHDSELQWYGNEENWASFLDDVRGVTGEATYREAKAAAWKRVNEYY